MITNIRMPKMNGLEMLEKCREINTDFVSIIITDFSDHESAIKALRLGVFEYLRKPISLEEVITLVGKGIDQLSLRRGLVIHKRELEIENALKTQYAKTIEREKICERIFNLRARGMKIAEEEVLELFNDSQNRVLSLALIHDMLYKSKDRARIDFAGYIRSLIGYLFRSYNQKDIKLNIDADIFLDVNTGIPSGLIINELVANSLKYAFPEGKKGEIQVGLYNKEGDFTLIVSDNGIGFPEDFDFRNT